MPKLHIGRGAIALSVWTFVFSLGQVLWATPPEVVSEGEATSTPAVTSDDAAEPLDILLPQLGRLPSVSMTFSGTNLAVTRTAANEAVLEGSDDIDIAELAWSAPNVRLYRGRDGELVLGNIRYTVMSKDGELKKVVFKAGDDPGAEQACGVLIVIKNGEMHYSCNGCCEGDDKQCIMRMQRYEDYPAEEGSDGDFFGIPLPTKVTCGCGVLSPSKLQKLEPRPGLQFEASQFEFVVPAPNLQPSDENPDRLRVTGLSEALFAEDGDLLELTFTGSSGSQEPCGVVVEIDDDGSVKFHCEGAYPDGKPHCRTIFVVIQHTSEAEEAYDDGASTTTAKKSKYRIKCECQKS